MPGLALSKPVDADAREGRGQRRRAEDARRRRSARDRIRISRGAVADDDRHGTMLKPPLHGRRRVADRRPLDFDRATCCDPAAGSLVAAEFVERREHVAAERVHPRADTRPPRQIATADRRERIERRHADDRPSADQREPLHRRDADAQSGERARTRRDDEQVDVGGAAIVIGEQRHDLRGQPLSLRPRRIAAPLVDDPIVVHERDASAARRRIKSHGQHEEAIS